MAESKGWMKESEFAAAKAAQTATLVAKCQADVLKLAIIMRDLVYMAITEGETPHMAALLDHQNALTEIIGVEGEHGD